MAKRKKRDLWIIEYTGIDQSRDATIAYGGRTEALRAAADFIRVAVKDDLEGFNWGPEDEQPGMLQEILQDLDKGKVDDAIVGWLEYQGEYEPADRIAIGPSGFVSDSPHDYYVEK